MTALSHDEQLKRAETLRSDGTRIGPLHDEALNSAEFDNDPSWKPS